MPTNEKIILNYDHTIDYDIDPQNQVGTDADHDDIFSGKASNRTVPTPAITSVDMRARPDAVCGSITATPISANCVAIQTQNMVLIHTCQRPIRRNV